MPTLSIDREFIERLVIASSGIQDEDLQTRAVSALGAINMEQKARLDAAKEGPAGSVEYNRAMTESLKKRRMLSDMAASETEEMDEQGLATVAWCMQLIEPSSFGQKESVDVHVSIEKTDPEKEIRRLYPGADIMKAREDAELYVERARNRIEKKIEKVK